MSANMPGQAQRARENVHALMIVFALSAAGFSAWRLLKDHRRVISQL
jgi:hypothetical protein